MPKRILLFSCMLLACAGQVLAQPTFSEAQLREDMLFYKARLEKHHPNLYLYASKERVDSFFDSLYQSISQPMSEEVFYPKITLTSQLIKDGHTLILPSDAFVARHNSQSKFLPLQIGLNGNQLYVKINCTSSIQIEDGTIINSINGETSKDITEALTARQVRDGNNLSYSKWILNTYFREYYSYTFGHPDAFEISFEKNGLAQTVSIPALIKDSIYYYRQKNYPAVYADTIQKKGIDVRYNKNKNTAILTIKDFHSEVLKRDYHQNFTKEIKSIFEEIFSVKPANLVIDLRDNQGGDVENGVLLLSYLIHQPFRIIEAYTCHKKGRLVKCQGPCPGLNQPGKNQFTGQIYVLTNGGSFSNSVIVSSALKKYSRTIFVGTETGGNPAVLAGYARDFELPNTKIRVEIPTKRFTMTSLSANTGNGLIPEYEIENSIEDNIGRFDRQIDFVIKLIEKGR